MIILALDLATISGFAVDRPGGGPPLTGTFTLPGTGGRLGHGLHRFERWLYDFARINKAGMLVFEAPIIGGAPLTANVAMICIGLAAHVESKAAALDIKCVKVASQTVRTHFVGTSRGDSATLKGKVQDRCRQLGWDYGNDDNRADAAATWDWAKSTYDKKNHNVEQATALFANAAVRAAGRTC